MSDSARLVSPIILPFVRPEAAPILQVWRTFVIGGRVVRFAGERWRGDDADRIPYPYEIDPQYPDRLYTIRLIDLASGQVIPEASCDEVSRHLRQSGPQGGA